MRKKVFLKSCVVGALFLAFLFLHGCSGEVVPDRGEGVTLRLLAVSDKEAPAPQWMKSRVNETEVVVKDSRGLQRRRGGEGSFRFQVEPGDVEVEVKAGFSGRYLFHGDWRGSVSGGEILRVNLSPTFRRAVEVGERGSGNLYNCFYEKVGEVIDGVGIVEGEDYGCLIVEEEGKPYVVLDNLDGLYVDGPVRFPEVLGASPRLSVVGERCYEERCWVRFHVSNYTGKVAVRHGDTFSVREVGPDGEFFVSFGVNEEGVRVYVRVYNGAGVDEFEKVYYPSQNEEAPRVLKPAEGERVRAGDKYEIRWEGGNGPYDLFYECAGFDGESKIATGVEGSSYVWNVPEEEDEGCYLRVVDSAGYSGVSGEFAIESEVEPWVRVVYPNGGERFEVCDVKEVRWEDGGIPAESTVSLYYGKENYFEVATEEEDDGEYSWRVPDDEGTWRFKVVVDGVEDLSDGTFWIVKPVIHVWNPAGGEYMQGDVLKVKWAVENGSSVKFFDVGLVSGGSVVQVASGVEGNEYELSTGDLEEGDYVIRVGKSGECYTVVYGESEKFWVKKVIVVAPKKGEKVEKDSYYTIKWRSVPGNETVDIYFWDGEEWEELATDVSDTGEYQWHVTQDEGDGKKIKVCRTDGSCDESEDFSIVAPIEEQMVHLIKPNGGEEWHFTSNSGAEQTITWESSFTGGKYELYYSTDGGVGWTLIDKDISGNSYNWTVPDDHSESALIRVVLEGDQTVNDESDDVFTIGLSGDEFLTNWAHHFSDGGELYYEDVVWDGTHAFAVGAFDDGAQTFGAVRVFDSHGNVVCQNDMLHDGTEEAKLWAVTSDGNGGAWAVGEGYSNVDHYLIFVHIKNPDTGCVYQVLTYTPSGTYDKAWGYDIVPDTSVTGASGEYLNYYVAGKLGDSFGNEAAGVWKFHLSDTSVTKIKEADVGECLEFDAVEFDETDGLLFLIGPKPPGKDKFVVFSWDVGQWDFVGGNEWELGSGCTHQPEDMKLVVEEGGKVSLFAALNLKGCSGGTSYGSVVKLEYTVANGNFNKVGEDKKMGVSFNSLESYLFENELVVVGGSDSGDASVWKYDFSLAEQVGEYPLHKTWTGFTSAMWRGVTLVKDSFIVVGETDNDGTITKYVW